MTFSRLPYDFEEALAEVKMWRSSHIPAADIRALKHRIHELEGELMGYKKILDEQSLREPDAVATLTEEGWIWDGDQWQRPPAAQPCPTCVSLARAVMMDQTGRDA